VVTHGGYIGKRLGAFELAVGAPDYQGAKDTRALAADPTPKGPGKGSGAALPPLRVLLMLAVGEHSYRSAVRVLGLR
jgi:hypothetical protein